MKRLFTILLVCFSTVLIAQPCLPEGITFTTQEEIDSFQINYPDCFEIEGDIEISGDDITNLNGLNNLTSVLGGILIEDNTSLPDLTGLNNLSSVGGALSVKNNENLSTLFTFNNLTSVGSLNIIENNMLEDLNGLANIGGDIFNLTISNNASLLSISLENINLVDYILTISDNDILADINLNNLQFTEWFGIYANPALVDISSLNNLEYVWALSVINNNSLTNLNGLQNLTTINAQWRIENNSNLTDISALENVEIENSIFIFIKNNLTLSDCDIQNLCDYLLNGAFADIQNNDIGCNSIEEVKEACLTEVEEFDNENGHFKIYPNPTMNWLFIEQLSASKNFDIKIQNLFGQLVKEEKNIQSSHHTINVADLKPGVYFYVIKEKGEVVQQGKLIKK